MKPQERRPVTTATRLESAAMTLGVSALAGGIAMLFVVASGIVGPRAAVVIGLMAVLLTIGLLGSTAQSRGLGFLYDHRYLICTFCRYPLEGLGPSGVCPECGGRFNREAVEAYWRGTYSRHNLGYEGPIDRNEPL
jgi:hypothetical protein